jgi:hypothetical protein
MTKPERKHIGESAVVSEMAGRTTDLNIDVPFAPGVDIEALTAGDEDPLFVTVEALNPTVSRNNRIYTEDVMEEMARQINEMRPDAFQGHIKDEDRSSAAPMSQTIWVGAKVVKVDGVPRLFIKGYVMPYAKERKQYLRARVASGKAATVSIYGEVEQIWNKVKKAWEILTFKLESIDWSRLGAEGVPTLGHMQLAKEMKGDTMEREEVIKTTTLKEMEEHNPDVVEEAKNQGRQEVEDELKVRAEKAETEKQALEDAIPEGAEKKPETLQEMAKEHSELLDTYIETALEGRLANKAVRQVAKQSVMSEMAGQYRTKALADQAIDKVLESEEMKSIMQEMAKPTTPNPADDNRPAGEGRKYTKL